ncbi:MAG TPA: hypothetical protein VM328_03365 [Fimbriimonadaceae bacterium]|nr:hypothetical protein [Fimbriimonadaceae bacterium]
MVLTLDFQHLPEAVRRYLERPEAFVSRVGAGTLITAANPTTGLVIRCLCSLTPEEARGALQAESIPVLEGAWGELEGASTSLGAPFYICAIAYVSGESKPGLWLDASSEPLTTAQALRTMYEEFVRNGEVAEISLEEFIQAANPNVVLLSPDDLVRFAEQKRGC